MGELDDFNFLDHQGDKDINSLAWFREPICQKGMVLSQNHFSFPPENFFFKPFKITVHPGSLQIIFDKLFNIFKDPTTTIPIVSVPGCSYDKNIDLPETEINDYEHDVSNYIRCNRKDAYKKGQKDFDDVMRKTGNNPLHYFRENKKDLCEKLIVETDTPSKFSSKTFCNTSIPSRSTEIYTPVSGVKNLPKSINDSLGSPFNSPENSTPTCSDAPINSPWTPTWFKSTILSGLIFYVDVREEEHKLGSASKKPKYGTEKMTSLSAKEKLKSLGATVKTYFTKKVTHVLFKNGDITTYQKAKKLEIPLVSVLWLLECDRIQSIADPKEFQPINLEKYENFTPTVRKRVHSGTKYDYLFEPGSIIDLNMQMLDKLIPIDIDLITDKRDVRKPRKAATERKRPSKERQKRVSNKRICSKKLFDDCEKEENIENVHKEEQNTDTNFNKVNEIDSNSTDDSLEIIPAAANRRKSAPGNLLSKKSTRQADIKTISTVKDMEPSEDGINPLQLHYESLTTKDECEVPETGKRKLIDPSDIPSTSQNSCDLSALDRECTGQDSVNYAATPIRPKTNETNSKSRKLFKNKNKKNL